MKKRIILVIGFCFMVNFSMTAQIKFYKSHVERKQNAPFSDAVEANGMVF